MWYPLALTVPNQDWPFVMQIPYPPFRNPKRSDGLKAVFKKIHLTVSTKVTLTNLEEKLDLNYWGAIYDLHRSRVEFSYVFMQMDK